MRLCWYAAGSSASPPAARAFLRAALFLPALQWHEDGRCLVKTQLCFRAPRFPEVPEALLCGMQPAQHSTQQHSHAFAASRVGRGQVQGSASVWGGGDCRQAMTTQRARTQKARHMRRPPVLRGGGDPGAGVAGRRNLGGGLPKGGVLAVVRVLDVLHEVCLAAAGQQRRIHDAWGEPLLHESAGVEV